MHRHLGEHLYNGGIDKRKDNEVHGYKVPSLRDLTLRVNRTLEATWLDYLTFAFIFDICSSVLVVP